jgi:hypothetical protein
MTEKELSKAKNPDLRGSLAAMQRAAQLARQTAIQTNTGIVVVRDGKRVVISAEQLREEERMKGVGHEGETDSLHSELACLAAQLHDLQNRGVREYEPIVNHIIRSGSRNVREIEAALDGLLDFAGVPDGLKIFKALCRYYYFIDPVSTACYVQSYRELWEDDWENKE